MEFESRFLGWWDLELERLVKKKIYLSHYPLRRVFYLILELHVIIKEWDPTILFTRFCYKNMKILRLYETLTKSLVCELPIHFFVGDKESTSNLCTSSVLWRPRLYFLVKVFFRLKVKIDTWFVMLWMTHILSFSLSVQYNVLYNTMSSLSSYVYVIN